MKIKTSKLKKGVKNLKGNKKKIKKTDVTSKKLKKN